MELPPADLGPTAALNKMLQLLQDILSSHDSSVVAPDERKTAFAQVRCHTFRSVESAQNALSTYLKSILFDVSYNTLV